MKNNINSDYGTGIPKHKIVALAECLLPEIRQFFESKDGKREFESWKAEQAKTKEVNKNNLENERN